MIVPKLNRRDLAEIPATITDGLTFHFVDHMDEVLRLALIDPDVRQPDVTPDGRARRDRQRAAAARRGVSRPPFDREKTGCSAGCGAG